MQGSLQIMNNAAYCVLYRAQVGNLYGEQSHECVNSCTGEETHACKPCVTAVGCILSMLALYKW